MDSRSGTELKIYSSLTKSSPHKKRRRRKRHDPFDLPGVFKLEISEYTQKMLGCVVGEDITTEKPWIYIKKELVEDDIERLEGNSEFYKFQAEIAEYPKEDILIGYITDIEKEEDEFYICLTAEAQEKVQKIVTKFQEELDSRLQNSVVKCVYPWDSLGSEIEVEEEIIRNNRPLLEVEIESKYPIITNKVRFRFRLVDAARDGYAEMLCVGKQVSNILKKRIDASIQVAPTTINGEAQTICTYPKNAWTQYEYEFIMDENPREEFKKSMSAFLSQKMDGLDDILYINSFINFYRDDYQKLVKLENFTHTPIDVHVKEHMSFTDINICKNKMISSMSWHHMWSGVLVAAYVNVSPAAYVRTSETNNDDVVNTLYGVHPVLLWSFNDALHPKLYLECHRDCFTIRCCPFDENLIVGGLANGQVIIWDIRNKLQKVEEEEILTTAQQKYRIFMFSLMNWMTNIKNIAIVPIAAVSDLQFSHTEQVTHIEWISPKHEVTKTGHLEELDENSKQLPSLQFATCSLDGTVAFWDLHAKPVAQGDYKPQKKLRRLKNRPSALTLDVSPLRVLNRLFRPHYKLSFPKFNNIMYPLVYFQLSHFRIEYEEAFPNIKKHSTDRVLYKTKIQIPQINPDVVLGTTEGQFMFGCWEGFEYSSGEIINQEACKINFMSAYHDGPVMSVRRWPLNPAIILTVGGKIFAIWKKDINKPILWRKSKYKYTHGNWCTKSLTMIKLTRSDGNIELWHMFLRSDQCVAEQTLSGKILTGSYSQPMGPNKPVIGVADHNGSFRMYIFPTTLIRDSGEYKERFSKFIEREIERKIVIWNWQDNWNQKNASLIQKKKEELLLEQKRKEKEEEVAKQKLEEERERIEKEEAKKALKSGPPPGEYKKWAEEQWMEREKARMNTVLLSMRKLNPEIVRKQQIPLKKIEKEEEAKKKKQRKRLQNAEIIFNENVAMFFPNALEVIPPPPPDPYAGGDSPESKQGCFNYFNEISSQAGCFIKKNPFSYEFDWNHIIRQGNIRRNILDKPYNISKHKDRYQSYKQKLEAEETARMEEELREQAKYTKKDSTVLITEDFADAEDENDD